MIKYIVYALGFFIATLLIQWMVFRISKGNGGKWQIYTGPTAIISLCIIGLIEREIAFLAAIIGFVIANEIVVALGWHKK